MRCGYVLNAPSAVKLASNKLKAFELLNSAGIKIPKYTLDVNVARKWARKRIVFGRRLLRSSSGRGIEIYKRPEDVREGLPLYVRYVPKKDEYRVHVMQGRVIDVQKKMRRSGEFLGDPETRNMVRNYDNGWVFGRAGIAPPRDVIDQSIAAVAALGLDFGAVDVGWTENIQQATVYEVNTAPGLTGTTLSTYIREFGAEMYRRASRGY
jgi:glutathione synthase/RimK-type ligase-like ATP-grasp enzyme